VYKKSVHSAAGAIGDDKKGNYEYRVVRENEARRNKRNCKADGFIFFSGSTPEVQYNYHSASPQGTGFLSWIKF
jgi:hypothetical protein